MLKLSHRRRVVTGVEGSAKTDTLVKLVLIFFISLLSFSVGTFVGKQFSDSQYKMAQLEGDTATERDPASVDPSSLEAIPPDALTEEDIASLEEEFAKGKTVDSEKSQLKTTGSVEKPKGKVQAAAPTVAPKVEPAKVAAQKTEHQKIEHMIDKAAKTAETINHDAKHVKALPAKKSEEKIAEIANKVIQGEAPVPHVIPQAERAPSSLPKTVANDVIGKYTVQVSSYSKEPDAVEHTKALKEKGFSAFYIPANVNGKTWFRVNVGLYGNAKEAEDYRKKIVGQDIKSGIVQKVVQN